MSKFVTGFEKTAMNRHTVQKAIDAAKDRAYLAAQALADPYSVRAKGVKDSLKKYMHKKHDQSERLEHFLVKRILKGAI